MRRNWIAVVLAALLGIPSASPTFAADPETGDWDTLRSSVVGQNVEIRADERSPLRGKIIEVTDDEIRVQTKKQLVSIRRAEVEQVAVKQKSKRARNVLLIGAIGAGIAAAIGLGIVAGTGGSDDVAGVVALPIALGGAAGAGIGAAVPGGYRTVYRR